MSKLHNQDNEKIELSAEQQNPALVAPSSFEVICGVKQEYENETVSRQTENSPAVAKRGG